MHEGSGDLRGARGPMGATQRARRSSRRLPFSSARPGRHRRAWLLCLLAALVAPRAVVAQDPPPLLDTVRVRAIVDSVRELVFDSLAMEPLAGALVVANPGGATTTTDSLGRFALFGDSVVRQFTVYHEVLDQIGLGALMVARSADLRREVTISTPSLPTLWPKPDYATGGPALRAQEALTDSIGNFLMCGIEEFVEISFLALSSELRSSVITIPPDVRSVRRVDLVLGGEGETGRVRGVVRNRDGTPLQGIQLAIDGADEPLISVSSGGFEFPRVPTGSRMLDIRAVGYQPVGQLVDVIAGENEPLSIPFDRIVQLEGVTITERATTRLDRSEFELRRRAGFSRVVDSTMLTRFPHVRAAIQMTPGVIVQAQGGRATTEIEILGRRGRRA